MSVSFLDVISFFKCRHSVPSYPSSLPKNVLFFQKLFPQRHKMSENSRSGDIGTSITFSNCPKLLKISSSCQQRQKTSDSICDQPIIISRVLMLGWGGTTGTRRTSGCRIYYRPIIIISMLNELIIMYYNVLISKWRLPREPSCPDLSCHWW